ncbi:MAG: hypothetical protein R3C02_25375 [Planctomycetaceae bacterium]
MVVVLGVLLEQLRQSLVQLRLIVFDAHHVVRVRLDNGLCRLGLSVHGVQRDHRSLQFQELQQHRHGGNLVRLLSDRHLPQHEPRVGGKGRDGVQRRLTSRLIERTPQRLPVDGDPSTPQRPGKLIDPLMHGREELARVQPCEHAPKRVVRRHPMRQFDVLSEPVELGLGEPLDIGPAVRSTDCSGQRHENHLQQIMIAPPIGSRVCHMFKMTLYIFRWTTHVAFLRAENPN